MTEEMSPTPVVSEPVADTVAEPVKKPRKPRQASGIKKDEFVRIWNDVVASGGTRQDVMAKTNMNYAAVSARAYQYAKLGLVQPMVRKNKSLVSTVVEATPVAPIAEVDF